MRRALVLPCGLWLALGGAATAAADTPDGGANGGSGGSGANISVQVDANGDTTLEVRRGQVAVKANGSQTKVRAGETVRAPRNQPLHPLLPPATPLAPLDGVILNTLDVTLSWQPVPGAARYLVEIAADPEFHAVRTQTVTTTRARLHLDTASTWYWRVLAVDKGGHPGRSSLARRLTIDTTPPKLRTGKPEWH